MNPEKSARTGWDNVALAVVVVGALGFVAMSFFGPGGVPREAANRSHCVNNLKQLGIALYNYHDTFKAFPPAYFADAEGKPMHSWRVLLLPYIEEPGMRELYEEYRFDQPWNSPYNQQLADKMPHIYSCPSNTGPAAETSYLAVVGPETGWSAPQSMNLRGINDGSAVTIALVEVANSGINWLDPRDLSFAEAQQSPPTPHGGGANHLFFDGSVHFLKSDIEPNVYRGLLTANGGEAVTIPE